MRVLPLLALGIWSLLWAPAGAQQVDVLVYGGTPAGISAALAAAQAGDTVLLVEPTSHVGGMLTNGLSHPDFRTFEGLTGPYRRLQARVLAAYRPEFGEQAAEVTFRGTHAEPKVNQAILDAWLKEQPRITVQTDWALEAAQCSSEADVDKAGPMRAVETALFTDARGERHAVGARYFIDATYEGDLLAAVGAPYAVGREGTREYGEGLAPAEADGELQAYNFRLCMTDNPANRVLPHAPRDYRRDDFTGVLQLLADERIKSIFGLKTDAIYKTQIPLPHGKRDINDMSRGPVRLSRPGFNLGWPDGSGGVAIRNGVTPGLEAPPFSRVQLATTRQRIMAEHVRWQTGLLYFLQNDEGVPEPFRMEARQWGWCRDEFEENGHLPEQLYVREARRLLGMALFTQSDVARLPGDTRTVPHGDSIAIGDYGPNCHGTEHEGPDFGGAHTGEFYQNVPPYQISYGVLVPQQVENLLVPGAVSASHVGFCCLRYEPIWMSLGEAAGLAVHLAREAKVPLQKLPVATLQARLHAAGNATLYFSDVPPEHPQFAAAQWWGLQGGFHDLAVPPWDEKAMRGKKIQGQYYEAFPGHAAELESPLTGEVATRWQALAQKLGLAAPPVEDQTRGAWLQAVWEKAPR